jgi:F0F1-type ATP synthase membrane subunit a
MQNIIINSPLEQFEINTYITITSSFLDISALSLTNFAIYTILIFFIVLGLHTLTTNNNGIIPSK